jgi:hypothetical protein
MMTSIKSSTVAVELKSLGSGKLVMLGGQHTFIVTHQDFTIEHLIISQDIIDHLFVQILGR